MSKINVKQFGIYHPYVFYHNDMDGKASAWLLHKHFENLGIPDSPSDYQHFNYETDGMKLGSINKNTVVYIVDLSFTDKTCETLLKICAQADSVIWIDHHDSSIDLITKHHPEILHIPNLYVFVNKDACGAVLTHVYIQEFTEKVHPLEDNYQKYKKETNSYAGNFYDPRAFGVRVYAEPDESRLPYIDLYVDPYTTCMYIENWLEMIDDHDRHCLRSRETRAFIEGTGMENTSIVFKSIDNKIEFNDGFWGYLDRVTYDYIDNGNVIIGYTNKKNRNELNQCFEYTDPETGAKIICKNDRGSSYNFLELYELYDAVCLFRYDGSMGRWVYSLYNDKSKTFSCQKFCQRFGGGGHFHAAGFSTPKLIFNI